MKWLALRPIRSCILALGCWISVRLPRPCHACSLDTFWARCFNESSECALLNAPSCLSGTPVPGFTVCSQQFNPYDSVCDFEWILRISFLIQLFLCFFYRGIQHQHSGEASSHHRFSGSWLSLPHSCGCHRHCLQSVSRCCLGALRRTQSSNEWDSSLTCAHVCKKKKK